MRKDEILKLMDAEGADWDGDNVYQGLQILSKYSDKLILGASKDMIHSIDISVAIDRGITKKDILELRRLNWMIEDGDYFACFV